MLEESKKIREKIKNLEKMAKICLKKLKKQQQKFLKSKKLLPPEWLKK